MLALEAHDYNYQIAVYAAVGTAADADACDRYRHVAHEHTKYCRENLHAVIRAHRQKQRQFLDMQFHNFPQVQCLPLYLQHVGH